MADSHYIVELLLQKKEQLTDQLGAIQRGFTTGLNQNNITRLSDIAQELSKVCEALKAHGYADDERQVTTPAFPEQSSFRSRASAEPIRASQVIDGRAETKQDPGRETWRSLADRGASTPLAVGYEQSQDKPLQAARPSVLGSGNDAKSTPKSTTPVTSVNTPQAFPNTEYTHIVLMDGKPVELTCYVCNANCSRQNGNHFRGIRGYHMHVSGHESEVGLRPDQTLLRAMENGCVREVGQEDIRRIKAGQKPINVRDPTEGDPRKRSRKSIPHTTQAQPEAIVNATSSDAPQNFTQLDKDRYPTVIFFDGAWIETWCHKCKANTFSDVDGQHFGQFFNGIVDLHAHVVGSHEVDFRAHGFIRLGYTEVAKLCYKRELMDEEVKFIKTGGAPATHIAKCVDGGLSLEDAIATHPRPARRSMSAQATAQNPAFSTVRSNDRFFTQPRAPKTNMSVQLSASISPNAHEYRTSARGYNTQRNSGSSADDNINVFHRKLTEYEQYQCIQADAMNADNYRAPRYRKRKNLSSGSEGRGNRGHGREYDNDYETDEDDEEPIGKRKQ